MFLKKLVLLISMTLILAACSKSGGSTGAASVSGGDDDSGSSGSGGGGISTSTGNAGPVELTVDNVRSASEHALRRVNILTAEVMRLLKPYLYPVASPSNTNIEPADLDPFDPLDKVMPYGSTAYLPLDVNQIYANSNDGTDPIDPFFVDGCLIEPDPNNSLDGIYGVEFRDIDFTDTLTAGDKMIFSADAEGCFLSSENNYARAPDRVSGIVTVTFAAGSDVTANPRRLVGTMEFRNYAYNAGLLAWVEPEDDVIQSGSVDFDITFTMVALTDGASNPNYDAGATDTEVNSPTYDSVVDISNAIFSNADVSLRAGNELIGGPTRLTFNQVQRVIHDTGDPNPYSGGTYTLGDYNVRIDEAVFESQGDGSSVTLRTIPYPVSSSTDNTIAGSYDEYPVTGAIEVEGANGQKARIPAQPDFIAPHPNFNQRQTVSQVDANNDGDYLDDEDLFVPTSWDFMIGQFLVPGGEYFSEFD